MQVTGIEQCQGIPLGFDGAPFHSSQQRIGNLAVLAGDQWIAAAATGWAAMALALTVAPKD
jgi:hypothetical protein